MEAYWRQMEVHRSIGGLWRPIGGLSRPLEAHWRSSEAYWRPIEVYRWHKDVYWRPIGGKWRSIGLLEVYGGPSEDYRSKLSENILGENNFPNFWTVETYWRPTAACWGHKETRRSMEANWRLMWPPIGGLL